MSVGRGVGPVGTKLERLKRSGEFTIAPHSSDWGRGGWSSKGRQGGVCRPCDEDAWVGLTLHHKFPRAQHPKWSSRLLWPLDGVTPQWPGQEGLGRSRLGIPWRSGRGGCYCWTTGLPLWTPTPRTQLGGKPRLWAFPSPVNILVAFEILP